MWEVLHKFWRSERWKKEEKVKLKEVLNTEPYPVCTYIYIYINIYYTVNRAKVNRTALDFLFFVTSEVMIFLF